jgi:hypothetical protein
MASSRRIPLKPNFGAIEDNSTKQAHFSDMEGGIIITIHSNWREKSDYVRSANKYRPVTGYDRKDDESKTFKFGNPGINNKSLELIRGVKNANVPKNHRYLPPIQSKNDKIIQQNAINKQVEDRRARSSLEHVKRLKIIQDMRQETAEKTEFLNSGRSRNSGLRHGGSLTSLRIPKNTAGRSQSSSIHTGAVVNLQPVTQAVLKMSTNNGKSQCTAKKVTWAHETTPNNSYIATPSSTSVVKDRMNLTYVNPGHKFTKT